MDEVLDVLKRLGIPYAYDHFAEGESPEPPFICYRMPESNNFSADGTAYFKVADVDLELYTDRKDPETEKKVERLLTDAGIFFDKQEVWIAEEKLYEVVFSFAISDDKEDTEDGE
ncbi:MAG: hypothetical protein DUD30_00675 [Lactobacillus sp.]|nr:MAG: hypothetical protein DUD30_00675 [Lactobacillus sp.]